VGWLRVRKCNWLWESEFSAKCNLVLPLSVAIILSLRSCCSCLYLLPYLTITSIIPSILHSVTCFRMQFLHKLWPIQLASILLFFVGYSSPCLYVILFHSLHDHSNWCPSFSSTIFQNFHHHTKLCTKLITLPIPFLNLISVCWWKDLNAAFTVAILALIQCECSSLKHIHIPLCFQICSS